MLTNFFVTISEMCQKYMKYEHCKAYCTICITFLRPLNDQHNQNSAEKEF